MTVYELCSNVLSSSTLTRSFYDWTYCNKCSSGESRYSVSNDGGFPWIYRVYNHPCRVRLLRSTCVCENLTKHQVGGSNTENPIYYENQRWGFDFKKMVVSQSLRFIKSPQSLLTAARRAPIPEPFGLAFRMVQSYSISQYLQNHCVEPIFAIYPSVLDVFASPVYTPSDFLTRGDACLSPNQIRADEKACRVLGRACGKITFFSFGCFLSTTNYYLYCCLSKIYKHLHLLQ